MSAPVLAPELMLLAAIERAERQVVLPGKRKGARRKEIVAHLGLDWHSGNARRLKGQLEALRAEGCVEIEEKMPFRSIVALTRRGHDRLQLARRQKVPEAMAEALPESPQHREWREARAVAEEREDEIRSLATDAVQEAQTALLKPAADSADELMAIGDRLHRVFWRFASVVYVRQEWAEPDERSRDEDPGKGDSWLHSPRRVNLWPDEKLFDREAI
jgi:DNA-binding PadR family transcriptional regulator